MRRCHERVFLGVSMCPRQAGAMGHNPDRQRVVSGSAQTLVVLLGRLTFRTFGDLRPCLGVISWLGQRAPILGSKTGCPHTLKSVYRW